MYTPCNRFSLPPKSQILAVFSSPTKNYFLLFPRYPLAILSLSSRRLHADNYCLGTEKVDSKKHKK